MSQTQAAPFTRSSPPNWARGKSGGWATTTKSFIMPEVGDDVSVYLDDTSWLALGANVLIGEEVGDDLFLAYFEVSEVATGVVGLVRLTYEGSTDAGEVVPAGVSAKIASRPPMASSAMAIDAIDNLPLETTVQGALRQLASAGISLRAYGAIGDGIADDTAAVQSAISAMTDGAELFVPEGNYRITSQLLVTGLIGFKIRGAGPRRAKFIAGSAIAAGAVLKIFNSQLGIVEGISVWAEGLAAYGVWLDTDNSVPVSNVTFINVEILKATVEGLRIASSIVNNYQVDLCTFIGCSFYGSLRNVGIHSTNALEHCFYNCQFAVSDAAIPDYHFYVERGGIKVYGGAGIGAAQYDFFHGQGARIEIRGWYTESQKVYFSDFIASHLYPTILDGIVHNVATAAGNACYYDIGLGYLKVTNCRFGGPFYLNAVPSEATAYNNKFGGGFDFTGNSAAVAKLSYVDQTGRERGGRPYVESFNSTNPATGAIAPNFLTGNVQQYVLTGNVTIGVPTNGVAGARMTFIFYQDGAGGYSVGWNASIRLYSWSDTGNTAGKFSTVTLIHQGSSWVQDGAQSPYN